ncbi:DUF1844 domain-containing protein [bacterium]|nr:DUF1844 domain-containing protein [bacterium]MBR6463068.1 DUF1844 domain-containing protein [bacterium]
MSEEHEHAHDHNSHLFVMLIFNFAQLAMVNLGKIANPETKETKVDLQGASYFIDSLVMLREKSKGNLSKEESDLLNDQIAMLQMNYAETAEDAKKEEKKEDPSETPKSE